MVYSKFLPGIGLCHGYSIIIKVVPSHISPPLPIQYHYTLMWFLQNVFTIIKCAVHLCVFLIINTTRLYINTSSNMLTYVICSFSRRILNDTLHKCVSLVHIRYRIYGMRVASCKEIFPTRFNRHSANFIYHLKVSQGQKPRWFKLDKRVNVYSTTDKIYICRGINCSRRNILHMLMLVTNSHQRFT